MSNELELISKFSSTNKIDPTEFDITISAFLIGVGAEKYIDIFKKNNIGQCTLMELTSEDLYKLGVEEPEIRLKILREVKNLPVYEESLPLLSKSSINLGPVEIVNILEETSQHLYRIYLSMLANSLAVKRTAAISDCLLYKDIYASDIAISTINEITTKINSMDIAIYTQLKMLTKESKNSKNKKVFIGTVGSAVILVLTVLFVKSIKQLK